MQQLEARPVAAGVGAGLIASLCCGGALVFSSIGLGAFFGALGLARYIPQALAAGALCIVAINYLFYRRAAGRIQQAGAEDILDLRRAMFASAALGIAAMAVSFVFLEWLNHAVVNPHFLSRPEYVQALIPGVPNVRLLYALASFLALALLWALPWSRFEAEQPLIAVWQRSLRVSVFAATGGVLIVLVVNAMSGGSGGHGGGPQHTGVPQHGSGVPQHGSAAVSSH